MYESLKEILEHFANQAGAKATYFARNPSWDEGDFVFEVDFGEGLKTWYPWKGDRYE